VGEADEDDVLVVDTVEVEVDVIVIGGGVVETEVDEEEADDVELK